MRVRWDAFIPLRSTIGFELWMGNRAGATGFLDESQFPIFNRRGIRQYAAKGEVAYMRDKSTIARAYICSHPPAFLRLKTVRIVRFWTGTGTKMDLPLRASCGPDDVVRRDRPLALAAKTALQPGGFILLPLMLFPLPYCITHAEFRYRLVIDPLLMILAAYAVLP